MVLSEWRTGRRLPPYLVLSVRLTNLLFSVVLLYRFTAIPSTNGACWSFSIVVTQSCEWQDDGGEWLQQYNLGTVIVMCIFGHGNWCYSSGGRCIGVVEKARLSFLWRVPVWWQPTSTHKLTPEKQKCGKEIHGVVPAMKRNQQTPITLNIREERRGHSKWRKCGTQVASLAAKGLSQFMGLVGEFLSPPSWYLALQPAFLTSSSAFAPGYSSHFYPVQP